MRGIERSIEPRVSQHVAQCARAFARHTAPATAATARENAAIARNNILYISVARRSNRASVARARKTAGRAKSA